MRARRMRLAWLAMVLLAVAGCANIPEESTPQAVQQANVQAPGVVEPPDPNATPLDLVRAFIRVAGNPEAARLYLTDRARQAWRGESEPTIIADTFGTLPVSAQERKAAGSEQNNETVVVLTGHKVGRLDPDRAFVPAIGEFEERVTVRRQPEGWRIDVPPETVLITHTDFNASYRPVKVYFFTPDLRVAVPDLRYVASHPQGGLPDRVIAMLLAGPSDTLEGAVKTMLSSGTRTRTNVVPEADGALLVNLTQLDNKTTSEKQLIAKQIVLSLQEVLSSRVRLKVDGRDLVPGRSDWRLSDIDAGDSLTYPHSDLKGLVVAAGQLKSLADGQPVKGPAGTGEYQVESAAQSIDGSQLAAVSRVPTGVRLRVGRLGEALAEVNLEATTLTRPTWLLAPSSDAASNEVWTVKDGGTVVRVVRAGDGTWGPGAVNATELARFGRITDLRLSRDGVRVAAVAGGSVVVASVVRTKESVTIRSPRELQDAGLGDAAVGLDWLNAYTLVAVTGQGSQPVVRIPVDGKQLDGYNSANLTAPITAIAAAPDRPVVVTDNTGMWAASEITQVWTQHSHGQGPGALPFYPG